MLDAARPARASALAAVLVLAGCASDVPAPPDVATYQPEGSGFFTALLTGVLERLDGCLLLIDDSDATWIPVFPKGVAWSGDILMVGAAQYPLDERVQFGGGEATSAENFAVPNACPDDAQLWLETG